MNIAIIALIITCLVAVPLPAVQTDLQAALNAAECGSTITLPAGSVHVGKFTLPVKPCTDASWITITSSRAAELPEGVRVSPAQSALFAKLQSAENGAQVIKAQPGAHHYRFIGIEVSTTNATVVVNDLVRLGDSEQTSLSQVPHHIDFDRCYIHGFKTQAVTRGISLNSAYTSITNSYISDIHEAGRDTQAICGWNGPGPYKIINNYLEAAGENVMFGGADPSIPNLVPSDIEIRRNYFFKPLSWRVGDPSYGGIHWTVKNLFELKNARRVVIDGNIFENSWVDGQVGFALLIKSQNQDGRCPWCVSEDITITNNIIRGAEHGLNVLGIDPYQPAVKLTKLRAVNNLWDVRGMWYQGTDGADDIALENNTHLSGTGNTMTLYGRPTTRFVVRNNLGLLTGYGIKGDGTPEGTPTLQVFAPDGIFANNILVGDVSRASSYPTSFKVIASMPNPIPTGIGVNHEQLQAAIGGSIPSPTPSPTPVATPIATPVPTPVATPVPTPVPTPTPTPVPTVDRVVFKSLSSNNATRIRQINDIERNEGLRFLSCSTATLCYFERR